MTIHAIFTITVTNPDSMAKYREVAGKALAKHGGALVQASPAVTVLDGPDAAPTMAAILSFPDANAANAWHSDPDLADAHDLRRGAGQTTLLLLA